MIRMVFILFLKCLCSQSRNGGISIGTSPIVLPIKGGVFLLASQWLGRTKGPPWGLQVVVKKNY